MTIFHLCGKKFGRKEHLMKLPVSRLNKLSYIILRFCICQLFYYQFAEYGNWRIHVALRNLRPPGTKERRIPKATGDPMTLLFNLVTCPNYTYEAIAWVSFTVMTQCVPGRKYSF